MMMTRATFSALFIGLMILINGCRTNTTIDEYRAAKSRYNAGEKMVLLGRRHEMDRDTENDFIACVGKIIEQSSLALSVIPEKQFVDTMYPWFEASTAPMHVDRLDDLFKNQRVYAKFEALNLRYLVWINGFTETTDSNGSMSCAVGPGGGGCFGFKSWDDEANYEAAVWDLQHRNVSAKINTETEGTSYVPAVIIPIPLLARVKATACEALGSQLVDILDAGVASNAPLEGAP